LAPRELFPDQNLTDEAYRIADENHAKITITDNFVPFKYPPLL